MATPTITTPLTPTTGRTGGRYLLVVTGTNFRTSHGPLPATGAVPKQPPTVRVWFLNGMVSTEAERVDVISDTQLHVLVPSHDPATVSLVVANVDAAGATISGEVATAASAFEFKRPQLSGEPRTAERILARVVRTLRRLFAREVIENTVITIHTDFDAAADDGTNTVEAAALPSLLMVGPNLSNNRFYSTNVRRTVAVPGGFAEVRPSRTEDAAFTLLGISEFKQELQNFAQEVVAFFERNPYLYVDRDPSDPSAGKVRYELALTSDPQTGGNPNDSNLRQFTCECVIRGIDLDDENMIVRRTAVIEEVLVQPPVPGTGAGGDSIVGDGTTNPITGGPNPWPVYLDPAIYQLALDSEE